MRKRILSVDGGGVKGIFAARLLREVEEIGKVRLADYFDLIAGTSTGGIIAAGLALGLPAETIHRLYAEHAETIFPRFPYPKRLFRMMKKISGAQYSGEPLQNVLTEVFGEQRIGNCKTRLLIPSYNIAMDKPQMFKTSHSDSLLYDYKLKITDALLATTAAPTYLPPYKAGAGTYIDGGMGANNPSIMAVIEGITRCGWDAGEIEILSIGCSSAAHRPVSGYEKMGFVDVDKMINIFMSAESKYSEYMTEILLGGEHTLRIQPHVQLKDISLDNSSKNALEYLDKLGITKAQAHLNEISERFLYKKAEPFIPCHKL